MESRPLRRWALLPGPLAAPWLLGWLLSPWTLQLSGRVFLFVTGLLAPYFRASFMQLIPVSGDLLVAFEHCRLRKGSLWGPGDV